MGDPGDMEQTDAQKLQTGMRQHRETTDSARNAAQIAARTQEVAKKTLVDLRAQGEQIERTQAQYEEVEHDVDRAESILNWLSRCCWCCNWCRADEPTPLTGWGGKHYQAKGTTAAQERRKVQQQTAIERETEAASQQQEQQAVKGHVVGNGLDGPAGEKIREESRAQDQYLDIVDSALNDIKGMGKQMQAEIEMQNARLDDFEGNTDHVGARIKEVKRNKQLRKYA